MRRKISVFVCILLCAVFVLGGCADRVEPQVQRAARTENGNSGVPMDFWYGKALRISTVSDGVIAEDIWCAENDALIGDPMYDAMQKRAKTLQEEYGITVQTVSPQTDTESAYTYFSRAIKAADTTFDYICTDGVTSYALAREGMLYDLSTIEALDLTSELWDATIQEQCMLGGVYFLTGEYTTYDDRSVQLIAFSKELWERYADLLGAEDPYTLVQQGSWTLEKMYSTAALVAAQKQTTADRDALYGCMLTDDAITGFLQGADVRISRPNALMQRLDFPGSKTDAVWNALVSFYASSAVLNRSERSGFQQDYFQNGGSLFYTDTLAGILQMRALRHDFRFGLLPYPKYDVAQPAYYAACAPGEMVFMSMPITVRDVSATGYALQALAYVSAQTLTPAFYEKVLYGNTVRDTESEPMLRLILSSKSVDLANMCNWGGCADLLQQALHEKWVDISARYRRNVQQIEKDFMNDMQRFATLQ